MSLSFFFADWFGAAPNAWSLFKRCMANAAVAVALIFVLIVFQAPADLAVLIIVSVFAVNGVMFYIYNRQRR
jgi:hypothetical protein